MQTYIISYDIEGGDRDDYDDLHEAIEKCSIEANPITESTWALVTEYTSVQIRDYLIEHLPDGSRLFVVRSGIESAWWNVFCRNKWLKGNL